MVSLEKQAKSYLSVSARIRVIDPFRPMKREYNTILDAGLDDADSVNRNNFVLISELYMTLPGKLFST